MNTCILLYSQRAELSQMLEGIHWQRTDVILAQSPTKTQKRQQTSSRQAADAKNIVIRYMSILADYIYTSLTTPASVCKTNTQTILCSLAVCQPFSRPNCSRLMFTLELACRERGTERKWSAL